ncbi:uncharacterized protein LOC123198092 [Mangifera indica]|uniref:uncharacterized protein LOC123198092 n=1 Tax=Mangifera indica TaxID=29780 RepID=UPI001CF967A6|nr:uncharacterized protein LOC123198092 [Mangifera indica]
MIWASGRAINLVDNNKTRLQSLLSDKSCLPQQNPPTRRRLSCANLLFKANLGKEIYFTLNNYGKIGYFCLHVEILYVFLTDKTTPLLSFVNTKSLYYYPLHSLPMALNSMLRHRLFSRFGSTQAGPSRWTSPGHQEKANGYLFNRTPPPPGQSRKWEDWELPCYITSFLTVVILGVGLNAKPDLTIETWAHQKALERLQMEKSD